MDDHASLARSRTARIPTASAGVLRALERGIFHLVTGPTRGNAKGIARFSRAEMNTQRPSEDDLLFPAG